jgi:hypothetical protein
MGTIYLLCFDATKAATPPIATPDTTWGPPRVQDY